MFAAFPVRGGEVALRAEGVELIMWLEKPRDANCLWDQPHSHVHRFGLHSEYFCVPMSVDDIIARLKGAV